MSGRRLLFSRDSECLRELLRLIGSQSHRMLVMWALDCAQHTLSSFESACPDESRPRRALEACEAWARGWIRMREAKKAILDAHSVAKETDDKVCVALAHAIGQAGSTVHVKTHASGLVFYELTGIVHGVGLDKCEVVVRTKIDFYFDRLRYWRENAEKTDRTWAAFLQ